MIIRRGGNKEAEAVTRDSRSHNRADDDAKAKRTICGNDIWPRGAVSAVIAALT